MKKTILLLIFMLTYALNSDAQQVNIQAIYSKQTTGTNLTFSHDNTGSNLTLVATNSSQN